MTGQTSKPVDIHHHSALVERHWVTAPVSAKASEWRRKAVLDACRAAADTGGAPTEVWTRPGEIGVSWTVVVGEVHALAAERHPFWVWTPRWRHWLATLTGVAHAERGVVAS